MGVDFKDMARIQSGLRFTVTGNTYPVKEILKNFKCRWDGDERLWRGNLNRPLLVEMTDRILEDAFPAEIQIVIERNEDGKKETINL